ncbi:hypothetical protein F5882DRAFT_383452 [Hyaloscypha sp. PMI_1271]|nr:hypothetical protein F5882DRAFT_383452 [Hyaloscypha sp. PMI_1271]
MLPILPTSSQGSSSISVSSVTTTRPPSPSSTGAMCGAGVNLSCQGSDFGNCCGSDNTCGHDAKHCGTGCQIDFGFCTNTSNDGSCGNNVTCRDSVFGDCCSEFFFCGSDPSFCGTGCQPDLGLCTQPSSTVSIPSSSTSVSSIAVPSTSGACTFSPGLGDTIQASIPAPAVYTSSGIVYSFGFINNNAGSLAYATHNPSGIATDEFAFYQVSTNIAPPTIGCTSFGYLYQIDSGLCVTANKTGNTYPDFQGSNLALEPCYSCSTTLGPPQEQLFCTDAYTVGVFDPYQCILFFGDTTAPDSFYAPTYGTGPNLVKSTVVIGGGECIFLLFP